MTNDGPAVRPSDVLCRKCDLFVGYGASGVCKQPEGYDEEWLRNHCWSCRRSVEEIQANPRDLNVRHEITTTPIDRYVQSYTGEPRGGVVKDIAFNRKQFGPDQPENPDQGQIYVGGDGIRVELVQDFDEDTMRRVLSFAINATRGIDPENPPEPVDWEEMLKGGLQTALEDIRVAFAIYGVSRTMTHQLVRTRQAAFHQQSQRAHYYGDRPSVRMPESWLGKVGGFNWSKEYPVIRDQDLAEAFAELAEHSAHVYRMATDAGVSYQDARFCLLEGTTNFILWEGSLREFINTYAYRACSMFQWEIVLAFRQMKAVLVESHPWLEPYIKISCEKTSGPTAMEDGFKPVHDGVSDANLHRCTYQGWENVEGQCDFEWARESNRTFRSEHHRIEDKRKPEDDERKVVDG